MGEGDSKVYQKGSLSEVILIAGFLGAGKTTLMRNILQWPGDLSGTAILVNEFGKIGIDGELLQGFNTPVYELTNGCICCTIQADFQTAITEILNKFQPKRILIEATGVADPHEIVGFLRNPQTAKRVSTPKIVTVLSGDFWEGREYFGPLFYNQIKAADLLLFNKVDLLPKEEIPLFLKEVKEINPSCALIPTYHCEIDPASLWAPVIHDNGETEYIHHEHAAHGTAEELGYLAFAFEETVPFRSDCFHRFVGQLPINLFRMKGFARLDDRRFFLNHVGGKTEWVELDEPGGTRLAFVGWEVNEKEVSEVLKGCLNRDHN